MSVYHELITDRTYGDLLQLKSILNKSVTERTASEAAFLKTDMKGALNASDINRLARVANLIGLNWIWPTGTPQTDLKATYDNSDYYSEGGDILDLANALALISSNSSGGQITSDCFKRLTWDALNKIELELKSIIQIYYNWLMSDGQDITTQNSVEIATEDGTIIRVED